MKDIAELVDGYRRFLKSRYSEQAEVYRSLAETGQSPSTMVIACCDSRVDPATIFNSGPGQLFVLRNVANLVPPYEARADHHGTGAALEFAVGGLQVSNILVMGHGRCGGVQAYLQGVYERPAQSSFIDRWMKLLDPAWDKVSGEAANFSPETQLRTLEHASVRNSIENLKTFPFVQERVAQGSLLLHGAYFDISDGKLMSLDPQSGRFEPVS